MLQSVTKSSKVDEKSAGKTANVHQWVSVGSVRWPGFKFNLKKRENCLRKMGILKLISDNQ